MLDAVLGLQAFRRWEGDDGVWKGSHARIGKHPVEKSIPSYRKNISCNTLSCMLSKKMFSVETTFCMSGTG